MLSNYPKGFPNGVALRGVPVALPHPGKVFWVSSTVGLNGNKGTYENPFQTIDFAVGRCRANKGDIIFVMPGHVETVTAAAGLDLDVAGITLVGLGNGNLRPFDTRDYLPPADRAEWVKGRIRDKKRGANW